jgi:uncharacterized membrane protein YeaQ/YmgE (transglycosylase-associated protein family)
MAIIVWVLLGLVAGFLASLLVNRRGEGVLLDIVLGIVGALVGGFIMSEIGNIGVTGFNLWSIFVATFGAMIVLLGYHLLVGHRMATSRKTQVN